MNGRRWTKHGKLPYITYDTAGAATGGAGTAQKPGGTSDTSGALAFAVGDVVQFTGNTHYTSAAAIISFTMATTIRKIPSFASMVDSSEEKVYSMGGR